MAAPKPSAGAVGPSRRPRITPLSVTAPAAILVPPISTAPNTALLNVPSVHFDLRFCAAEQFPLAGSTDFPLLARHQLEVVVFPVDRLDIGAGRSFAYGQMDHEGQVGAWILHGHAIDRLRALLLRSSGDFELDRRH